MIEVLDKRLDYQRDEQDSALQTAKVEMDRRLEGMNEFREQLEKREKEAVSRAEFKIAFDQLTDKVNRLEVRAEKFLDENDKEVYEAKINEISKQKAMLDGKMITAMCIVAAVISALIIIGAKMLGHTG
jgi:hypothetical protein